MLNEIKQQLLAEQQRLNKRLDDIKVEVRSLKPADFAEQASARENDEVLDALGNETRLELLQINHALDRIEMGTYEDCSHCGENIPLQRLQAVPFTNMCIECADRLGS